MLPELEDSDWEEVFKYATPHCCVAGHNHGPTEARPGIVNPSCDIREFTREDVAEIIAMVDGENDGENWVGVFKLNDYRYVCIRAGCDYTGWG